ncbi:MAG TPA: aminopeptidase P N-terminal domain-containing protein [Vicinamibacteria bacterium]
MLRAATSCLIAALFLVPAAGRGGELQDDLKGRRARLLEKLDPETIFVLFSSPTRVYSLDVDYEYRQDSDMLYLTGSDQEDTTLVLMPGNKTKKEILFVHDPDPRREHWQGHLFTVDEARAASGIDTVYLASQWNAFIGQTLNGSAYPRRSGTRNEEYDAFFDALKAGKAKLALVYGRRPGPDEPLTPVLEFARAVRERSSGVEIRDVTGLVSGLRQVKTAYERKVLARSVEISAEAHVAAMKTARPGRWEYEVEAALEQVYLANGAMSPGYPSIVASGPNATVLHYGKSSRQMKDGDLLLLDAAGSYQGLTGDITRTYPVNGTFTAEQREIYRIALAAQDAGAKAAVVGNTTNDVEKAVAESIKEGLLRIGLITDTKGDQFRTWATHGVCHWIGMDVHDVGDYRRPLEPGMAFVIEPGIYIRETSLDNLEKTAENKAFSEKVRPAVAKYKDIGVRIEDSFLLTESGLVRMSAKAPWKLEELEALLKARPPLR